MMFDYLVSYDAVKREFRYFTIIKGNTVEGNWPIYTNDPIDYLRTITLKIDAQHDRILEMQNKEWFSEGKLNKDNEFRKKIAEGKWFNSIETIRQYLESLPAEKPTAEFVKDMMKFKSPQVQA